MEYSKGQLVFHQDDEGVWHPGGKYVETEGENHIVVSAEGEKLTVDESEVFPMPPPQGMELPDVALLGDFLHESSIGHMIMHRASKGEIYTYVGPLLLALNPYERLPLYTPDLIKKYGAPAEKRPPPHVFHIAGEAYRRMMKTGQDQTVLLMGESGSGKTEATKHVMQFLSTTAGASGVSKLLLCANVVLEAMGHAATVRNENSSRFSKIFDMHFSKEGSLVGAQVDAFSLDRARVLGPGPSEGNFKIFYMLAVGASPEEKKALLLGDPAEINYIQKSLDSVDAETEAASFARLKKSLKMLGITGEQMGGLLRNLVALMYMGNIKFKGKEGGGCCFDESSEDAASTVATLLVLEPSDLEETLSHAPDGAGVGLSPEQASFLRDMLVRTAYARLFSWCVSLCNRALAPKEDRMATISTIDMAGFEAVKVNGLHQMLTNYFDDRLFLFFVENNLEKVQREFISEEIGWEYVEYENNKEDVDLMSANDTGILSILAGQCAQKGSERSFLEKVCEANGGHQHFKRPKEGSRAFAIKHHGGGAVYRAGTFVDLNKEHHFSEHLKLFESSECPFTSTYFAAQKGPVHADQNGTGFQVLSRYVVEALETKILALKPSAVHFVLCLAPNRVAGGEVDPIFLQQQCNGHCVIPCARIVRQMYPVRWGQAQFFNRFCGLVSEDELDSTATDDRSKCLLLCKALNLPTSKCAVGKTKVFFRGGILNELENLRLEFVVLPAVTDLQRVARGHLSRKKTGFKFSGTVPAAASSSEPRTKRSSSIDSDGSFTLSAAQMAIVGNIPGAEEDTKDDEDEIVSSAAVVMKDRPASAVPERAAPPAAAAVSARPASAAPAGAAARNAAMLAAMAAAAESALAGSTGQLDASAAGSRASSNVTASKASAASGSGQMLLQQLNNQKSSQASGQTKDQKEQIAFEKWRESIKLPPIISFSAFWPIDDGRETEMEHGSISFDIGQMVVDALSHGDKLWSYPFKNLLGVSKNKSTANGVSLVTKNGQRHTLYVEDADMRNNVVELVDIVVTVIKSPQVLIDNPTESFRRNFESVFGNDALLLYDPTPNTPQSYIRGGFVDKKGRLMHSQRYLILRDGIFSNLYILQAKKKKIKPNTPANYVLTLRGATCESDSKDKRSFRLAIRTRDFVFRCETEKEKDEWMHSINLVIGLLSSSSK